MFRHFSAMQFLKYNNEGVGWKAQGSVLLALGRPLTDKSSISDQHIATEFGLLRVSTFPQSGVAKSRGSWVEDLHRYP